MTFGETDFIERLRAIATHEAARGLNDDAALLDGLVITHDMIAQGVHFLPFDPPASVGWKLVAVNLSDLAAKGATPLACLMGASLSGDERWDMAFASGVAAACEAYGLALIGGDTIALPAESARVFSLTAIGRAGERTPNRSGARPNDVLWVVGPIGDAGAGLIALEGDKYAEGPLIDAYRQPIPQLAAGRVLGPLAHAMMDVSDGLLIDALRMAQASDTAFTIALDSIPLSRAFIGERGPSASARLFAATAGDDYALLAALAPGIDPLSLGLPDGTIAAAVGKVEAAPPAIRLTFDGAPVDLPHRLGFLHGTR